MPNIPKMLNILYNKVSIDPQYFAWYFKRYMEFENKKLDELLDQLSTDEIGYYHIALCKAPNGSGKDFTNSLNTVSDFTKINIFPLLQIVRSVDNMVAFKENPDAVSSTLMAAREKDSTDTPSKKNNEF